MKILRLFFCCLLSSFFLAASFPSFNLSFFSWFGFLPLLFTIQNKTKRQAFWLAYICGFVFFILILYWLVHVTLIGLVLLCLYLAFYFAFFGYFFTGFKKRYARFNIPLIVFLSSIWVVLEYLRSQLFSGFPWTLLGYSQYQNLNIIQFSDIAGSFSVSFLVIFVNLCLFRIIRDLYVRNLKSVFKLAIILLAVFIAAYGYGVYSINKYSHNNKTLLRVSLIQGNISQEEKWLSSYREKIKTDYIDLSLKAREDSPDIIIWPETSYPEYIIEEDKESIIPMLEINARIGMPVLFGAVYQRDNHYFNSAILLKGVLEEPRIYKKIHLVPFGEYLPLRKFFFFLEPLVPIGDFSAGSEFVIFNTENKNNEPVNFGVLICFEDTIVELSRQFVLKGADFLVNITNDAWFKESSSPYQHLQASVFRAVENRTYLVRAANTGVTCVIDNCGRIIGKVQDNQSRPACRQGRDIFVKGFMTSEVAQRRECPLSFYTRSGDWFVLLCILLTVCFAFSSFRKKKL